MNREGIRQVDIRTGAQQEQLSLAQKLSAFGKTTARAIETADTKRFNESLKAHEAAIDRDLRSGLAAYAAENPANLEGFDASAGTFVDSTLSSIDPEFRDLLQDKAKGLLSAYRSQVEINSIQANRANEKQNHLNRIEAASSDAARLMRNGEELESAQAILDAEKSYSELVLSGHLAKADADRLYQNDIRNMAEQSFMAQIDNAVSAEEAYTKIDELSEKIPAGWSPDEWDTFLAKAQIDVNRRAKREVDDAKVLAMQEEADALVEHGKNIFDNGYPVDPYKTNEQSKYDLEAVNSYYDAAALAWNQLPVNEQINNHVEFVSKTGVIPTSMETRINAFTRSGGVEQVAMAAETLSRIQETSPQALRDLPAETKAIMLATSDAVKSGTDVALAVEAARKSAYGLTSSEREEIKIKTQEFNKELSSSLEAQLDRDFDPGIFGDEPDAPPAMQADYKVGFDRYMLITGGDSQQSAQLSYGDLINIWAESRIGGEKRFMKYAPEAMYHIDGVDDSWINKQFEDDLADYPEATIVVSPQTARNNRPEYAVFAPNEQGLMEPIFDDQNRPLVWQPDFTQTDEYIDLKEAPARSLEKAKRQRDINNEKKFNSLLYTVNSRVNRWKESPDVAISNALAKEDINEQDAEKLRAYYASQD